MKLPRDLSARQLLKALQRLDYSVSRQSSSHIRLTTLRNGEHHITVPNHDALRTGTLHAILTEVGHHHALDRNELLSLLFD